MSLMVVFIDEKQWLQLLAALNRIGEALEKLANSKVDYSPSNN